MTSRSIRSAFHECKGLMQTYEAYESFGTEFSESGVAHETHGGFDLLDGKPNWPSV